MYAAVWCYCVNPTTLGYKALWKYGMDGSGVDSGSQVLHALKAAKGLFRDSDAVKPLLRLSQQTSAGHNNFGLRVGTVAVAC